MADLQIVDLSKHYDGVSAVDGISLDVPTGEFVVILGPSGCGKTTTLRCIAGLESVDAGSILIDGNDVTNLPPRDRDVAMVFQNYALYPHMTVADNIGYPLRMKKLQKKEVEERVTEITTLLGIKHLLSRRPRQLSGGEQQRVALGRAIVRKPKVFLMDEPLSNLDAKLRLYTRAELKKLQEQLGVTTVYVTHDQAEALALADRIAIMNKGKVLQYDTPQTIYGRPKNAFAAGFVGNPPMNIIRASITRTNGRISLSSSHFDYSPSDELCTALGDRPAGVEVSMGIRPEDLEISKERDSESVLQAEVYVVESMGPNVLVDLRMGEQSLKCICGSSTGVRGGERVWIGFKDSSVHLFDAQSEEAIA